jgi:hypothetical protein
VLNKKTNNNNKYRRATDALLRSSPRLREEVRAGGQSSLENLVERGNPRHGPLGGPPGSHSVGDRVASRDGVRNAFKSALLQAHLACVLAPSS